MRLKRLLVSSGLWVATTAGVVGGFAFAAWSVPTPAFSFYEASVISWRGNGDSVPPNAASVGWAGPMFYTTPSEGAAQSGPEGLYPTGRWAPGDAVTRVLTVRNIDCDDTFQLDQLQIQVSGDVMLAPKLTLTVRNEEDQVLYDGFLSDFDGNAVLPLSQPVPLPRGRRADLTFSVSFDRSVGNSYQGRSLQADIHILASQVIHPLTIDVHPNSWPNPINPGARGNIPVAVNGSATLNVRDLDWETARFGPGRARPLRKSYEDWNGDGYQDLMLKFDNRASRFTCGMTQAMLTISGEDGEHYEGSDAIVTPPCR
ncbi:MAG TPA: hypothetical protein VD969_04065 [Symbiobacteriaceae bacterium]|nr:hypothetical protein [Symbiobacteriaceae bacterium]